MEKEIIELVAGILEIPAENMEINADILSEEINSKYPSATALRLNIINNKNSKERIFHKRR